jgi:hypothetical protein
LTSCLKLCEAIRIPNILVQITGLRRNARVRDTLSRLHRRLNAGSVSGLRTQFGSLARRILSGGVRLTPLEESLLRTFRENIDASFHAALDAQLHAYNLAQREVDWRAINLYRVVRGRPSRVGLPELPCGPGEVRLLRASVRPRSSAATLHVAFWAVDRYFFGFNSGESLEPDRDETVLDVLEVNQSWRSSRAPE